MTYRNMCMLTAALAGIYALSYTVAPLFTASIYMPESGVDTALMGRYFGTALWFMAIVCWLLKDCAVAQVRNALAIAAIVASVLGLATSLVSTVSPSRLGRCAGTGVAASLTSVAALARTSRPS